MTNRDVFNAAISLCGELQSTGFYRDYEERTIDLFPLVIGHFAAQDRAWRKANRMGDQDGMPTTPISMDAQFSLSSIFATPAAAMLASLLVIGENPDMSNQLNELSLRTAKTIAMESPMISESIADRYAL